MQPASYITPQSRIPSMTLSPTVSSFASLRNHYHVLCVPKLAIVKTLNCLPLKAAATNDTSTVDYSSITSVFPAEACEVTGGDACNVEMYPEAKLKPEGRDIKATTRELVDREYLDYNDPKTVFIEEACDDLGGEFCEPQYKTGLEMEPPTRKS